MATLRHPLTDFVLALYENHIVVDRIIVASALCGGSVHPGFKAYCTVADDVLGCMAQEGEVTKSADGWHRAKQAAAV
jgi:precorrin isomerase